MPDDKVTGAEGAETEDEAIEEQPVSDEEIEVPDDFDPARAMKTILAQRENEKKMAAELAAYRKAEEAAKDEERTLEERVALRDQRIGELEVQLAATHVEQDFKAKARERGMDPDLALAAALKEGLIGGYDQETGEVGEHDFNTLGERFPALVSRDDEDEDDEVRQRASHGAGTRGRSGKAKTSNDLFNDAVRNAIRSRM